ncbi:MULTISPECIES: hypothetical protein [unclassified Streptomyces]|uniref:hypothetical protein n=1 Tax=unclassified Streptomyces TaxID=2593676 RepID=UPI00381CD991
MVAHGRAAVRAERAPDDRLEQTFPVVRTYLGPAVVELREAEDAVAGGIRPAEVGPPGLGAAVRAPLRPRGRW